MRRAVAIDFDGTLALTEYPNIIAAVPEASAFIHECRRLGVAVILWTCRTGQHLQDALAWCEQQGIFFDAVNENLPDWIESWEKLFPNIPADCRKVCASIYIDDRGVNGISWQTAFEWLASDQTSQ